LKNLLLLTGKKDRGKDEGKKAEFYGKSKKNPQKLSSVTSFSKKDDLIKCFS